MPVALPATIEGDSCCGACVGRIVRGQSGSDDRGKCLTSLVAEFATVCRPSKCCNLTYQQVVADAYYVLSDPGRRAEYDSLFANARSSRTSGGGPGFGSSSTSSSQGPPGGWTFTDDNASEFEQEQASSSFFENFAQYFPSAAAGAAGASSSQKASGSGSGGGFCGMGGGKKEKEGEKERPAAHGVFGDVFEEM